ncbi:hypothetical protein [Carnobacterium divergens]|uniref:Uncharacterized protein n=1 Tax=Carnobacterium divergens TaxID=2748 RepID=A0AAW8R9V4_CARDV|nr:hypothetical protein [Carnobacterium divergens]MDT1957038.1 hypothetical protein [Carnobacterium divergens]MDT1973008.1 hypothetical protein [Carnobacterium divergens]MDT2012678.1 hypothetical protein [Carnobacterium divergens]
MKKRNMAKKLGLTMICGAALFTQAAPIFAAEADQATDNAGEQQAVPTPRASLGIIADGTLEGNIDPYAPGVPETGLITLHYTAKAKFGIGIFDKSKTVIELPPEFRTVAKQKLFKRGIKASIEMPGGKTHKYTLSETEVFSDRIVFTNPKTNYIAYAKYVVNVEIDYGTVLADNSAIKIPAAPYEFRAVLAKNGMIELDLIDNLEGVLEISDDAIAAE